MWITKIGSDSRNEFFNWLSQNCADRIHVPIWTAHEYLRHHVAGTITSELNNKASEITNIVGRTYQYFRPFIDEPYGSGADDPAQIRASTLGALNTLQRLVNKLRQWNKSYRKHATDVISFINAAALDNTTVYAQLSNVAKVAEGRFVGSVPPGFHDQGKGSKSSESTSRDPVSTNRYGDLILWEEILLHAKHHKTQTLIVLTNDRKNDWYMGGDETPDIDLSLRSLRTSWRPVPRPHPMLATEAKLIANVHQLELLDSVYLAVVLRGISTDKLGKFVDVALVPDSPGFETENDSRARLLAEREAADQMRSESYRTQKGYLFSDPSSVLNSGSKFRRALRDSRSPIEPNSGQLLQQWKNSVEQKESLSEALSSEWIADFDHKAIAHAAREMHDRALVNEPGYERLLGEFMSILDMLPLNTSASFYLGLLASMYLIRKTNASRLPPQSPVAQLLFSRQSKDYATNAIFAVVKRLSDNNFAPMYLPNTDSPQIDVTLDVETDYSDPHHLTSLRVGEIELLAPAQSHGSLRLRSIFDNQNKVAQEPLMKKASELFCLPFEQMRYRNPFEHEYTLSETIGFKRPMDLRIPKESSNGT